MDHQPQSPWWPLEPEDLPGPEATLKDIIGFSRMVDPTAIFRSRWGEKFIVNGDALLHRCMRSFRIGRDPAMPPDELLLCVDRQLAIAPYVGFSEAQQLPFLHWLISKAGSALQASPATSIRPERCRVFAQHEAGRIASWSFHVRNESVRPLKLVALSEVITEWGDRSASEPVDVRVGDLMPGTSARILDSDGELRLTIPLRIVTGRRDVPIRFSFPRLHRHTGLSVQGKPE